MFKKELNTNEIKFVKNKTIIGLKFTRRNHSTNILQR